MPGLLILDFDGTLADTFDDVAAAMTWTFEAKGRRAPDRKSIRRHMGLHLEASIASMGGPAEPTELRSWVATYRNKYLRDGGRRTALFPGAKEVLERAPENGLTPVLVSNKGIEAIRSFLARTGVAGDLAAVFAADTGRYQKPDRRLYHSEIRSRFPGIDEERSVVVGDTSTDLLFAQSCGLRSCWAAYGYGDPAECGRLNPTFAVDRLGQLPEVLSWLP